VKPLKVKEPQTENWREKGRFFERNNTDQSFRMQFMAPVFMYK
jgi:hypothetical protein